jgi:hypothetical protein
LGFDVVVGLVADVVNEDVGATDCNDHAVNTASPGWNPTFVDRDEDNVTSVKDMPDGDEITDAKVFNSTK